MENKFIWYRDLLFEFIRKDLKVKYKRSILGIFWSILNPLLMMIVMTIVFSYLFRFQIKNYPIYILSGIIFWNFFSTSTNLTSFSLISNSSLLKKVYFPRVIIVLSTILSQFINLLFAFIPLIILMFIFNNPPKLSFFLIPIPLISLLLFTTGLSFILSILSVYFTDISYIYQIILIAWMYLTPIFYPPSIVPQKYQIFLTLNPMYHIIWSLREVIYFGNFPSLQNLSFSFLFGILFFLFGYIFFIKNENKVMYLL
jgi:ABC-2 type transport system permease protein